ncbi:TadG family pilus assembly protein [Oxalicibacterium solurbis]|nr:TadG family pilus assembly protein [Oxalicibacterium solurbis]
MPARPTIGKPAPALPPHQRGSIAVMAALVISAVVILLASIDIGFLFYQKRELQKIADMAAIAGAQQVARSSELDDQCASAFNAAENNAQIAHGFSGVINTSCGKWDPASVPAAPHYSVYAGGVTPVGQPKPTAVRVDISRSFGSFFGAWAGQQVNATAIATASAPVAVFSVESRLLSIKDGSVPMLLAQLGVDINGTTLASYDGLANARITTGGLLSALGFNIPLNADVATIKNIVSLGSPTCSNGVCPLNDLLGAISIVGGQEDLINALGIQSGNVKLLTDAGERGLFTLIDTANGKAALDANVKAAELLSTAIVLAGSTHPAIAANVNLSTPGLLEVDNQIGIVAPPSIGIGGIGTKAFTSQVRMFTHVKSNLLNANLVSSDIPMAIDVVNGTGTIVDMCTKKKDGKDVATIAIDAPILKLCVGNFDASSAFSTTSTCSDNLQNQSILRILPKPSPANDGLNISTSFFIDALPNTDMHDFVKGETFTIGKNDLQLGTTLLNLMDGLLAKLLGATLIQVQMQGSGGVNNNTLAAGLLNATGNTLDTALSTVQGALNDLKSFVTGINTNSSLLATLGSVLTGLLNTVSNLANGLLNVVGNILNPILCLGNAQCILSGQLSGNQGSISKAVLTALGLATDLLQPILDGLGSALSNQLQTLLGTQLGQVDVTLIDLNCGGGENVKLVY